VLASAKKLIRTATLVAVAMMGASGLQASLIIGTPGVDVTNIPFGQGVPGADGIYQQFYDASLFTGGALTIDTLTFYNTFGTGNFDAAAFGYYFFFNVIPNPGNGWSTFYDINANPGTLFYSGSFSGAIPASFKIDGTDFAYDPANGGLLLTILKYTSNPSGNPGSVDANLSGIPTVNPNSTLAMMYLYLDNVVEFTDLPSNPKVDEFCTPTREPLTTCDVYNEGGLVTGFNVPDEVIPEPMTFSLIGGGLLLLGGLQYRRNRNS